MGAIVATTKTNAELLRKEKELGTIAAGKLADLILVNGDPLKDIKIFQQYREKISVIIQGDGFTRISFKDLQKVESWRGKQSADL